MATEKNFKGVRMASVFIMSAITIGSLAFAVGRSAGSNDGPNKELRERLTVVEKLCERWDERWRNLEKWMIRVESKLDNVTER